MHLPTGPTAVYHQHHHHLPNSPPQSDWNSNITMHSKSNAIASTDTQTSASESASPSGSTTASQDLWWTERLVLEAQQEFPGELGNFVVERCGLGVVAIFALECRIGANICFFFAE